MNRTTGRVHIIDIIISIVVCFDNGDKMTTNVPDDSTESVSEHILELRETLFKSSEHLLILTDK